MTEPKRCCDICTRRNRCKYSKDENMIGCAKFKKAKPMTNEEYIRQASTEELAKTVYEIAVTDKLMDRFFNAEVMNGKSGVEEALEWLKEIHE